MVQIFDFSAPFVPECTALRKKETVKINNGLHARAGDHNNACQRPTFTITVYHVSAYTVVMHGPFLKSMENGDFRPPGAP